MPWYLQELQRSVVQGVPWKRRESAEVQEDDTYSKDSDKLDAVEIGQRFTALGYEIYSTRSTCRVLNENGVPAKPINKVEEPSPNLLDLILSHEIDLVIDTPSQGVEHSKDGFVIRRNAIETGVTVLTSLDTAHALLTSLESSDRHNLSLVDISEI